MPHATVQPLWSPMNLTRADVWPQQPRAIGCWSIPPGNRFATVSIARRLDTYYAKYAVASCVKCLSQSRAMTYSQGWQTNLVSPFITNIPVTVLPLSAKPVVDGIGIPAGMLSLRAPARARPSAHAIDLGFSKV